MSSTDLLDDFGGQLGRTPHIRNGSERSKLLATSQLVKGFVLAVDAAGYAGWLPADHLVWFVIDVVDQLDLSPFRAAYQADGHGRPAYDPAVLGRSVVVRVLRWAAVLAGDRAGVAGGCRAAAVGPWVVPGSCDAGAVPVGAPRSSPGNACRGGTYRRGGGVVTGLCARARRRRSRPAGRHRVAPVQQHPKAADQGKYTVVSGLRWATVWVIRPDLVRSR